MVKDSFGPFIPMIKIKMSGSPPDADRFLIEFRKHFLMQDKFKPCKNSNSKNVCVYVGVEEAENALFRPLCNFNFFLRSLHSLRFSEDSRHCRHRRNRRRVPSQTPPIRQIRTLTERLCNQNIYKKRNSIK